MICEPRASSAASPSNLWRRVTSEVSRPACWYSERRSSVSSKSRMSLVAVSVPARQAGEAAAARAVPHPISRASAWAFWRSRSAQVAGAHDYPALRVSQNVSAAASASTWVLQGPPTTDRSPPTSFNATRALAHQTPSCRSVVIVNR